MRKPAEITFITREKRSEGLIKNACKSLDDVMIHAVDEIESQDASKKLRHSALRVLTARFGRFRKKLHEFLVDFIIYCNESFLVRTWSEQRSDLLIKLGYPNVALLVMKKSFNIFLMKAANIPDVEVMLGAVSKIKRGTAWL